MDFIAIVLGYVIGSLSGAIILSKIKSLPDPRQSGSGNAGATNMLRTNGLNSASQVLVVDLVKGLVAVLIGRLLGCSDGGLSLIMLATVAGHIYPVFFGFKGGKGVATMLGCLIGLSFLSGILCLAIWIGIVYVTRYASLASIITAGMSFVVAFVFGNSAHVFGIMVTAILVIWSHSENIKRLKNGTESKVNL